jgi:CRISPR-associated protein Cas2
MTRKRFLVTYDVADDKRRTHIFKALYGYGDHAQYSVFFCELSLQELAELRGKLRRVVHNTEDQILFLDLGEATNPLELSLECLGKPYCPTTAVLVV